MRHPKFNRVRHYLRELAHQPTLASTTFGHRRGEPETFVPNMTFVGECDVFFYNDEESSVRLGDHDLGVLLSNLARSRDQDADHWRRRVDVTIRVLEEEDGDG